ncbi:acyltransferase family protein [Bacteroides cellulosilyticus]|jgi:peptidoglycan/LPS O-acetylase OafA/YrhL|uniref:acyltransferase family protein n=2 Tax=Bacteroides cellulosilyticus TaxID=246787 RepID=UPI0018ACCED0
MMKQKNYSIEILRFILIFWIMLYHYTSRFPDLYNSVHYLYRFENGGSVGVFLFFLISGYFFSENFIKIESNGIKSIIMFVINKYWRLFPAYISSVIIIYLFVNVIGLQGRTVDFTTFIANFFIYHPGFDYVDGAHWFISDLFIIYVICSLFFLLRKWRHYFIVYFTICLMGLYYIESCCDNSNMILYLNFLRLKSILPFLSGLIIGLVHDKTVNKACLYLPLTIVFVASVNLGTLYLVFYFFIFCYAISARCVALKLPVVWMNLVTLSFYLYLVHQNIGYSIMEKMISNGMKSEFFLIVPITVTFVFAYIIKKLEAFFPTFNQIIMCIDRLWRIIRR